MANKRAAKILATGFAVALATIASGSVGRAAPAHAAARPASDFPAYICRSTNDIYCANLQNGKVKQATPIQLWDIDSGGPNFDWTFHQVGSVSSSGPFSSSGLNGEYSGDPYFQIEYTANTSYCIGVNQTSAQVNLQPCSSGNYWVEAEPQDETTTLVNVYFSNKHSTPAWLDDTNTVDGNLLYADYSVQYWCLNGSSNC
jgi:hypothetical protein